MGASPRICVTLGGLAAACLLTVRAEAQTPAISRPAYIAQDVPQQPRSPGIIAEKVLTLPRLEATPRANLVSLDQLIDVAVQNHPELAVARARLQAAEGKFIQAGFYPNPRVGLRTEDWGRSNPIGNPGMDFSQEFVTAGKLGIARAAASWGIQAADWQLTTRWFDVLTRVRMAYFDLLAAQLEVDTMSKIVEVARQGLAAATRLEKAGLGIRPDVLRAEVELEQNLIKLHAAERRREAGRKLLAAAVGVADLPGVELTGTLERVPPPLDWAALRAQVMMRSSEIQEALARVQEAEQLWRLAWAERTPNVDVHFTPFYAGEHREPRFNLSIGAKLPLFNRNQGNIVATQAEVARFTAEVHQVELRLSERLIAAFQRYQLAHHQVEAYRKGILPRAREARKLIEFGYEKGDPKHNFTTVLQAQQVLFQAELDYVRLLGDLWRSLTELTGLVQDEQLLGGGQVTRR
jgi:cobalt-zinc-cadmium efflux system outer membrane protein